MSSSPRQEFVPACFIHLRSTFLSECKCVQNPQWMMPTVSGKASLGMEWISRGDGNRCLGNVVITRATHSTGGSDATMP